jgi:hypothetical protein
VTVDDIQLVAEFRAERRAVGFNYKDQPLQREILVTPAPLCSMVKEPEDGQRDVVPEDLLERAEDGPSEAIEEFDALFGRAEKLAIQQPSEVDVLDLLPERAEDVRDGGGERIGQVRGHLCLSLMLVVYKS